MGSGFKARCLDCGKEFMVSEGPGFHTVILHCDKCGKETGIGHDEDNVLYFEYVNAIIKLPNAVNDNIEECAPEIQEVIKKCREIEKELAGKCKCGGNFTYFATIRCPKCHSTRIEDTETEYINWD